MERGHACHLQRKQDRRVVKKKIITIKDKKAIAKLWSWAIAFLKGEHHGTDIHRNNDTKLEDPNLTPDDFDDVVEQKSKLIEQLDNLDSGFEKLFERVKDELEGNKEVHKEEIRIMQEHIRSITDKSIKIQSQEARNKALMTNKFNGIKKQVREVRKGANVASKYYQSMTKTGYVDPQFMDNKK